MMAAQLIGTGGIAALLLLGAATGVSAAIDVGADRSRCSPPSPPSPSSRRAAPAVGRTRREIDGGRMSVALDIVTIAAVSAGAFFFLAGTVGLLRFPDTLHATARAHQGGQPRPRSRGARAAAAGGQPARRRSSWSASGCSSCWPARRCPSSSRAPRAREEPRAMTHDHRVGARDRARRCWCWAWRSGRSPRARPSPRSSASSPTDCCSRSSGCVSTPSTWR